MHIPYHSIALPARWYLFGFLLLLSAGGCVQEYLPEVISAENRYLVVDGFINGRGVTRMHLARTLLVAAPSNFPPETEAHITIESTNGRQYALAATDSAGYYLSDSLILPVTDQYRLHIRTRNGRDYASDFVALKMTPPIDNLEGRPQANGLQLYISAHDATNQTQYYRWDYTETWEFTSAYWSHWRFAKGTPDRRPYFRRTEDIYHCWRTRLSTSIATTSTVRLSQDAVRNFRLVLIPPTDGRIEHKYSILVRQYALSQAEFDYWEAVKKNTENIGTLFDPLPSQVQGNVHCLSAPDEPVLGFVGASSVVEQRIFIDRLALPPEWHPVQAEYKKCTDLNTVINDTILGINMYKFFADTTYRIPVYEIRSNSGTIKGFTNQTPACVDCRLYGVNKKPSYWP